MRLAEIKLPEFTVVTVADGAGKMGLELHHGFYTYYWKSRIEIRELLAIASADLIDSVTQVIALHAGGARLDLRMKELRDALQESGESSLAESLTLLRLDAADQSLVWQHAPDDWMDLGDSANFSRDSTAYVGTSITTDYLTRFRQATELMLKSAVESNLIARRLHHFEHYLEEWMD